MTIINFKVDDEKKKEIEEIAKNQGYKSISAFIRKSIDDKMNLQKLVDDFVEKNPLIDLDKIKIPDFIPDGKYLGISRNTIVAIGDTPQEVSRILFTKFPESAAGIIRKGKDIEPFETIFSLFSAKNTKCYHQIEFNNIFYPVLKFSIIINKHETSLFGLLDTGASIMTIDKDLVRNYNLKPIYTQSILTASGIIEAPIYKCNFQYEDKNLELKFTVTDIKAPIAFQALISKNFIDEFNVYFFGKEKLFCIQTLT